MRHDGDSINYSAGAAIGAYRLCKPGSADGYVLQAAGPTDLVVGVTGRVTAGAAEERVDVLRSGLCEVEYGATVVRGQLLASDADGKAVPAVRAALVVTTVAGGAAGDLTLAAITTADTLVSVLALDATDATEGGADLTSEFSIKAGGGVITNTGGTATSGKIVVVTYRRPGVRVAGVAEVSGVVGDIGSVWLAPSQI